MIGHRSGVAIGIVLLGSIGPGQARAQPPPAASQELRAVLENPSIPADDRARRALEAAAEIDATAQATPRLADRLARWGEAIALLDGFLGREPAVPSAATLRFQGGVYAWARGRGLLDSADSAPGDPDLRARAIEALDDAVRRLRGVPTPGDDPTDPFGQNVRFRLAQALADRARLDPEGAPGRLGVEREARGLLDRAASLPAIRGYATLLKAELATRLGMTGQAQIEVEEAEKATPAPPPASILEIKVAALAGRSLFDDAFRAVDASRADDGFRDLLRLRIALAARRATGAGKPRDAIDARAFGLADALRQGGRVEGRRGLIELARAIDEPPPNAPEGWWACLAEGQVRLGNPTRGGRLAARGGDRLEADGQGEAAARLRSKAGAYLFEAEQFAEADRVLTRVADAPAARVAAPVRARAGMLRALSRGRGLALHQPGASREAYLAALEAQVRDFPADPSSGEARWLLGKVRQAAGRKDEAVTLWSGIAHGHPRWLEASLIVADLLRQGVEDQRIGRNSAIVRARMDEARRSIRAMLDAASEGSEPALLGLRAARLELIPGPGAGDPARALEAVDRVLQGAASAEEHRQARLDRMVALAELSRFVEAEQVARLESKAGDPIPILPALRRLDRAAAETESDILRRKIGTVARVITARLSEKLDTFPPPIRDEVRLRHARATLFAGDPGLARREIAAWGGPGQLDDADLLRDLADTYLRLDAFALAIDVERIRSGRLAPGSLPWFEARYGLALAYFRSHQPKEAARIIDATAILHEDLGGGDLKARFQRLRQRIEQE